LLDPSQYRSWPQGQRSADHEPETHAEPVESPEVSVHGLVSAITSTLDGDVKTAGVEQGSLNASNIWRHPDAHPLVLGLLLLDRYGEPYTEWHPDVLKLTLQRDGLVVSNASWTKILATRTLLQSPSPWRRWEVFHWVCRALSGMPPNFTYFEKPEIGHLVSGVNIMKAVDPKRTTGLDVDKFVAAVFRTEGYAFVPEPLEFARRELEGNQIECASCHAVHRDDNDVKCITCGSKDLKRLPYEFSALRDETEGLWKSVVKKPLAQALDGLPDTTAGNAVYNLLIEWDYARDIRARLVQQLRMIGGR